MEYTTQANESEHMPKNAGPEIPHNLMLCRPAFCGIRAWSMRCFFNTARLRRMARLAERHLMHVVFKTLLEYCK